MRDARVVDAPGEPRTRAAAAENAVLRRYVRRLWPQPSVALADQAWPSGVLGRALGPWHYWWHAELLDCLVDAQLRDPQAERSRLAAAVIRGIRIRNRGWTRTFYDDMAWLALALLRSQAVFGFAYGGAVARLAGELRSAWSEALGGGIPWRPGDVFKNAPANGPAALVFARLGELDRAARHLDWIETTLRDPDSGLIFDGIRPGLVHREFYGYNHGTVLGAELELMRRTAHPPDRIHRLVAATADRLATRHVLPGDGFGDNGLFAGIHARYLALVATELPGGDPESVGTREIAAQLVRASAEAAWANRVHPHDLAFFGADWSRPAAPGTRDSDLSVQVGAWMLLEAAASLSAGAHRVP